MYVCICVYIHTHTHIVGRDSSVSIATCYWLDGPRIESRWGKIFNSRPNRPWGPPCLAVQ